MKTTKLLLTGLLTGALALGAGCATMHSRSAPPAPDTGGSGLDPNPDHNIPNSPGGIDADPINTPNNPDAPINTPSPDGIPEPGMVSPSP